MSTAVERLAELNDDVNAFRQYLQAERGMAANTLLAYGRDLERFAGWIAGGGLPDYRRPSLTDFSHYLGNLRDDGLAPASVARHLVALKMFYRFLRMEERVESTTVDLLSTPALWERIPQVLSPEAVERLLRGPNAGETGPFSKRFMRLVAGLRRWSDYGSTNCTWTRPS